MPIVDAKREALRLWLSMPPEETIVSLAKRLDCIEARQSTGRITELCNLAQLFRLGCS